MDIRDEIKELERRFAEAPDSRLFLPLADALFRAGEFTRAIDLCLQGLESYPDFVAARVLLGKCYNKLGQTGKARKIAEETSRLDSENEQLAEIADGGYCEPSGDKPVEDGPEERFANADSEMADIFITQTLADIYRIQGYDERALEIYHRLSKKNPADGKLNELIEYLEKNGVSEAEMNKDESPVEEMEEPTVDETSQIDSFIEDVVADTNQAVEDTDGVEKVFSGDILQEKVNTVFDLILGETDRPSPVSSNFSSVAAGSEESQPGNNQEYLKMVERWIGELAG